MPTAEPFQTLRTSIAGAAVRDLASRFGTPTYVYDAAKIVERMPRPRAVRRDPLRPEGLLEPRDSRPGPAARRAGRCGQRGRNSAGPSRPVTRPERNTPQIVYTADIFDREALDLVVELGIHVNCGSPDMIDQLGERAPGRDITLRINPGFGHGHSQKTNTGGEQSKHGIWHEQLADCLRRADHHGLPSPACTCTSAPAPTWSIWPRSAARWKRRRR